MSISKTQSIEDLAHINTLLESFKLLYNTLNANTYNDGLIEKVYTEDMEFIDCFHHINGIVDFKKYCASIYQNVEHCQFDFHDEYINSNSAMLTWTMEYMHPKLNNGKMIYVNGSSEIKFNKKIYRHKDYVDAGELLYEHVPLLKIIIAFLKKRMM